MATVPLRDASRLWSSRMKRLATSGRNDSLLGAKLMQRLAKRLAPRGKTGATVRGIRRRKVKDGWSVESWVSGSFKQNLWANQTSPFRTLRFSKPNRFFAVPQTVVYGRSAKSAGGRSIVWTGTPRFWHFSSLRMKKVYRRLSVRNTRKSLRSRF